MGTIVVRRGQDTFVNQDFPNSEHGGDKHLKVKSGTHRILLSLPMAGISGKTILSATLSLRVKGAWANQTITVAPLAAAWSAAKVNWANQPTTRAGTGSVATGVKANGDRVDVDITSLVQQVANGQWHYGWRVTTSSGVVNQVYGFEANLDAWTLTVVVSDAPQPPTSLQPNNGVVGRAKPTVACSFRDTGGSTEQASIQVQVSPTANPGTAWDSGEVATTTPELDLEDTSYPGLTSGQSTQWRVRVKDADGLWSPWSDWASWTYVPKPTLTVDTPAGSLLFDPTTTVEAHLSSGVAVYWYVMVANGNDKTRLRYVSGSRSSTTAAIAHTIPLKNSNGDRVFVDDTTYWLNINVRDRLDRVYGGRDDFPWVEVWRQVTFDDDAGLVAPTGLTAVQVGDTPKVTLTWLHATTPDAWLIHRDGVMIARVDSGDTTPVTGGSSWVDQEAAPNREHSWTVRAVVDEARGLPATPAVETAVTTGVWLIREDGTYVVLEGEDTSGLVMADRRATYRLPQAPYDVDIIGAFEGITGSYRGTFDNDVAVRYGLDEATFSAATEAILRSIKDDAATPVRLVYGTRNVPVLLRNVAWDATSEWEPVRDRHYAQFEAWQVAEYEVTV